MYNVCFYKAIRKGFPKLYPIPLVLPPASASALALPWALAAASALAKC